MAARITVKQDSEDAPTVKSLMQGAAELKRLEELEPGLQIDEHALDEALQEQPDLFYRVSKDLALLTSRRDAAKQNVSEVEAQVDLEVRSGAAKRDEKIPEREVDAQKRLHPKVKAAVAQMLQLNSAVGQLAALKEAFQQRSWVLKDLVGLYIANYYSDKSQSGDESRFKEHKADRIRARMHSQRTGR